MASQGLARELRRGFKVATAHRHCFMGWWSRGISARTACKSIALVFSSTIFSGMRSVGHRSTLVPSTAISPAGPLPHPNLKAPDPSRPACPSHWCWMKQWAANSFSECTSKSTRWKRRLWAEGRWAGSRARQERMNSWVHGKERLWWTKAPCCSLTV